METDIFTKFKENLSKHLQSIDELNFNSIVVKPSNCSHKGDVSIFTSLKLNNDILETLREASEEWSLPIQQLSFQNNTILISLNRCIAFSNCIKSINSSSTKFGSSRRFVEKKITFIYEKNNSLEDFTHRRIHLVSEVAKNLASCVGFDVVDDNCDEFAKRLYLTHKSNFTERKDHDRTIILCGVVQDFLKKVKASVVTVSEYKRKKNELIIMEMKERDKVLKNVTDLLTDAVLKFNLLHIKINSPVVINFDSDNLEGSDGTAIFILYNYSRLNAIIHEFEDRVEKRYYPPLPPVDSIDFSVLKEEKEWCIIFNFVLRFPSIVVSCIENIETGKFAPHLLCNFLHDMARVLSSYYRSTRILLVSRPQLLPLIFARMYFIKAVHQVFNNGLRLLTIQPTPAV